jgi:acetyl-CoA carboxylase biotin carboxyl carrier protein
MGKAKNIVIGGKEKLTLQDIKRLISMLRQNNVSEFDLEQNGMRLHIITGSNERTQKSREPYFSHAVSNPISSIIPVIAPPAAPSPNKSTAETTPAAGPTKEYIAEKEVEEAEGEEKYIIIKSPMVGTFYRAPAPDAPPYIEIGDEVKEDTVLCIVEAMKLMNEIKAETRGKIADILAENGQPVEYGQPLFLVEPQ